MPGVPGPGFAGDVRENNVDIVECVKCGHQMREADKEVREHVRKEEQVIGIFIRTSVIYRLF
ncbi:putative cytoplasmic protein [Klebsiella michiganensis]|nr:putative cytoplasmic protein [Klebsiella michiganensis]